MHAHFGGSQQETRGNQHQFGVERSLLRQPALAHESESNKTTTFAPAKQTMTAEWLFFVNAQEVSSAAQFVCNHLGGIFETGKWLHIDNDMSVVRQDG